MPLQGADIAVPGGPSHGAQTSAKTGCRGRRRGGSGTNPWVYGTTSTPRRRLGTPGRRFIDPSIKPPRKETSMNTKITLAMLMCGIGAVAAAGVAGAATPDLDAPSIAVKYDPGDPRHRRRRAPALCAPRECGRRGLPELRRPALGQPSGRRSAAQHAIESAVAKIHNPRLAAIYSSTTQTWLSRQRPVPPSPLRARPAAMSHSDAHRSRSPRARPRRPTSR